MISTHAFAEDALARAGVPALSIDPSGSRKAHYFRDDTVVEATDMVSRDSSCRRDSIAIWVAIPFLHESYKKSSPAFFVTFMNLRIFCKAIT